MVEAEYNAQDVNLIGKQAGDKMQSDTLRLVREYAFHGRFGRMSQLKTTFETATAAAKEIFSVRALENTARKSTTYIDRIVHEERIEFGVYKLKNELKDAYVKYERTDQKFVEKLESMRDDALSTLENLPYKIIPGRDKDDSSSRSHAYSFQKKSHTRQQGM